MQNLKNLTVQKIINTGNNKLENFANYFLPVKRMKLIKTYFPEVSKIWGIISSHIDLGDSFELKENTVYFGNNHFIHESLPMKNDVIRVFARITLPEKYIF